MNKFIPKAATGPEAIIQEAIIKLLRGYEWFVKSTHGNAYQSGFPDLYACHAKFGARWIEVKNPKSFSFTAAQLTEFPKFEAFGAGIWIMTEASDYEYMKLFRPYNYGEFFAAYSNGYSDIRKWRTGVKSK